jgi:26S proteasome regulatory subunit N9
MKAQWSTLVDLSQKEDQLLEKISLLAVMELSFQRNAKQRQLSFDEIVANTTLPKEKVELLVMKALSKGLIKGQIDQVSESVAVTWVQPRVLNKTQLASLQSKLDVWVESIHAMEGIIEQNGGEILTH